MCFGDYYYFNLKIWIKCRVHNIQHTHKREGGRGKREGEREGGGRGEREGKEGGREGRGSKVEGGKETE